MDWAIGELGQVEHNARTRVGSNQRIVNYLDTAVPGSGDNGDFTPWCGAFAAWVLMKHIDTLAANDPLRADCAVMPKLQNPLRAANWATWGTVDKPVAQPEQAAFGDIVLFESTGKDSSGHVAFVVAADNHTIWALGGNQQSGTRVALVAFDAGPGKVKAIRSVNLPPLAPSSTSASGTTSAAASPSATT